MTVWIGQILTEDPVFKGLNGRMGSFSTVTVETTCDKAMKWLWEFQSVERTILSEHSDNARDIVEVVNDQSMYVYR